MIKTKFKTNKRTFINGDVIYFIIDNEDSFLGMRAKTLMTKEPETITWLDRMEEDDVLWDVGACVGSYSIYAAVRRGVQVVAFEPASYNINVLEQNILLNKVSDKITSFPMGIGSEFAYTTLNHLNNADPGSSANEIEVSAMSKHRLGVWYKSGCVVDSIDNLVKQGLTYPTHLKVDVDGAEPDVVAGALETIPNLKSLLIELFPNPQHKNSSYYRYRKQHQQIIEDIKSMGMVLDEELYEVSAKRMDRPNSRFKGQRNYIFYGEDYAV
tara:strand:+ start:469 stop:1275 length:807 start_codon:yes stop_codon:yes gene_type:complete